MRHTTPLLLSVLPLCLALQGCEPSVRQATLQEVQGAAQQSPHHEERVEVQGVVTATAQDDGSNGFWLQDPSPDSEDLASSGLFVELEGNSSLPAVGAEVRAVGIVDEWVREGGDADLPLTLLRAEELEVLAEGRSLPEPVLLGAGGRAIPSTLDDDGLEDYEPGRDAVDFFESLEGMRIEVRDATVVGPTSRHGELVVVSGSTDTPRSARGGLVLREGLDLTQRIMIGPRLLGKAPRLAVGDRFEGSIVGVMDYSFGHFKILPEELPKIVRGPDLDDSTELIGDERHLTVATFNVLNLSAESPQEKFADVAEMIVRDLRSPDIVALQEIQDANGALDDGTVDGGPTMDVLLAAITAAGGPAYEYRQIDPVDGADGGRPGANIRNAFLFHPGRVDFVDRGAGDARVNTAIEITNDGPQLVHSPGVIGVENEVFENSRKPLVGEFRFQGKPIFMVNVHFRSKGGDDPDHGIHQPPRRVTEFQRKIQAEVVVSLLKRLFRADPQARVVVLGDTNDHDERLPLTTLKSRYLTNLVERVPLEERYTYIYQGRSQILDNVLVSNWWAEEPGTEVDIVHGTADLPDGPRASDHDPIVVRLGF